VHETIYQNLLFSVKAMFRGKCIASNAYIKKDKSLKIKEKASKVEKSAEYVMNKVIKK